MNKNKQAISTSISSADTWDIRVVTPIESIEQWDSRMIIVNLMRNGQLFEDPLGLYGVELTVVIQDQSLFIPISALGVVGDDPNIKFELGAINTGKTTIILTGSLGGEKQLPVTVVPATTPSTWRLIGPFENPYLSLNRPQNVLFSLWRNNLPVAHDSLHVVARDPSLFENLPSSIAVTDTKALLPLKGIRTGETSIDVGNEHVSISVPVKISQDRLIIQPGGIIVANGRNIKGSYGPNVILTNDGKPVISDTVTVSIADSSLLEGTITSSISLSDGLGYLGSLMGNKKKTGTTALTFSSGSATLEVPLTVVTPDDQAKWEFSLESTDIQARKGHVTQIPITVKRNGILVPEGKLGVICAEPFNINLVSSVLEIKNGKAILTLTAQGEIGEKSGISIINADHSADFDITII